VFVEGRLKLDTWDDKESGAKRSKMKVVVESFQFLDSGNRGGAGGGGGGDGTVETRPAARNPAPARGNASRQSAPQDDGPSMSPDDIPF
jgi:single-strand DNA-binding protein